MCPHCTDGQTMVRGAESRSNVQVLLAHELLSQSQLSTFLISILGTLKHPGKGHYKMVCLCSLFHTLLPSLLSTLNLDFQIPDIYSFSKYLLSTFRLPGHSPANVTKSAVSALTSRSVSFWKSAPFNSPKWLHTH